MVWVDDWRSFTLAVRDIFLQSPTAARYTLKYRRSDSLMCIKVTDNTTCIKFRITTPAQARQAERLSAAFLSWTCKQNVAEAGAANLALDGFNLNASDPFRASVNCNSSSESSRSNSSSSNSGSSSSRRCNWSPSFRQAQPQEASAAAWAEAASKTAGPAADSHLNCTTRAAGGAPKSRKLRALMHSRKERSSSAAYKNGCWPQAADAARAAAEQQEERVLLLLLLLQ
ncbi:hypothetical protein ACSSS7_005498 [Eimeria intestinalis]